MSKSTMIWTVDFRRKLISIFYDQTYSFTLSRDLKEMDGAMFYSQYKTE